MKKYPFHLKKLWGPSRTPLAPEQQNSITIRQKVSNKNIRGVSQEQTEWRKIKRKERPRSPKFSHPKIIQLTPSFKKNPPVFEGIFGPTICPHLNQKKRAQKPLATKIKNSKCPSIKMAPRTCHN